MSSSSSSSSESSKPSTTLHNFDPFAVHPFTNCAANQDESPMQYRTHPAYPYGPSFSNFNTPPHALAPPQGPPPANAPTSNMPRSPPYNYSSPQKTTGIFVPFRKDTSSPELGDVLKNKNMTTNSSRASSNLSRSHPTPPATQPIPLSYSRKY